MRVILDPEATEEFETLMSDVEVAITPGVTVTVGNVVVTDTPFTVPVMVVAVPAKTPVKTAV